MASYDLRHNMSPVAYHSSSEGRMFGFSLVCTVFNPIDWCTNGKSNKIKSIAPHLKHWNVVFENDWLVSILFAKSWLVFTKAKPMLRFKFAIANLVLGSLVYSTWNLFKHDTNTGTLCHCDRIRLLLIEMAVVLHPLCVYRVPSI